MALTNQYMTKVVESAEVYAKDQGAKLAYAHDVATGMLKLELSGPGKVASVHYSQEDWEQDPPPTPEDVVDFLQDAWENA